jgi:DNA helicase HerA-like ATPase
MDEGFTSVALRIGASGRDDARSRELVARLLRAAASVSAPGTRLIPRLVPNWLACYHLNSRITPLIEAPLAVPPSKLVGLLGWPIGAPAIPGLVLGTSPQLLVSPAVPNRGRVLGEATVGGRRIAQGVQAAMEHTALFGPTGSGKTWLAANLVLGDIAARRGGLVVDPKGGLIQAILDRAPEEAVGRIIVVDPTDEARPVPVPLLATEKGGIPELAADVLVGLLRHRYRDLGPRSSDILSSSLYALARIPDATLFDLFTLWSDPAFRSRVAAKVAGDPALSAFFAWFEGLSDSERNFVLAPSQNKIRPLLQRPAVRNVLAAPKATFTMSEAMNRGLVVLVNLPEGVLGPEATGLLGQVITARAWAAVQARARVAPDKRRPFVVTIDEAPRFLDQPTDIGDVLARSREYGVGMTLAAQSVAQYPNALREIVLNSARTKVAFQTSALDARRLAAEFGPTVSPDMLSGLGRYEAIGAVSLGGTVSDPFTMRTFPLDEVVPGRARAIRRASREQWGVPRADIEASFARHQNPPDAPGPVGRRQR